MRKRYFASTERPGLPECEGEGSTQDHHCAKEGFLNWTVDHTNYYAHQRDGKDIALTRDLNLDTESDFR